jgi:hypothetical protein
MAMPLIRDSNLSTAWARAFLGVMKRGVRGITPLFVHVTGLQDCPSVEIDEVRERLDRSLARLGHHSCHTVANTIFPYTLWEKSNERNDLYRRYARIVPRLRRHPENRNGLYFERMTAYGSGKKEGNQIEHLISIWKEGVRRPTAFVANIFDPARDHTRQRRRGFPCLHHVQFTPLGRGRLAIGGSYPTQFLFERAYGNYLGLYRLGLFVAKEMGLELTDLSCSISMARLGEGKHQLQGLAADLKAILHRHAGAAPQATGVTEDDDGS